MPAAGGGLGQRADRVAVAAQGQLGVAGTAVDIGPGGGVDDHLGPVARDQASGRRAGSSRS